MAAGSGVTCALHETGIVRCWGGDTGYASPHVVDGLDRILQIAVSFDGACARRTDGAVLCWGPDATHATGTHRWDPVRLVPGLSDVDLVAAGSLGAGSYCAHTRAGQVLCWGTCSEGQCGNGTVGGSSDTPTVVTF